MVNLSPRSFRKEATKKGIAQAKVFINFYETKKAKLLSDNKVKILLETHGVRDQEIHRESPPRHLEIELHEHVTVSHGAVRDEKGNVVSSGDSKPAPVEHVPPQVRFYLANWRQEDIPTLCEYCLGELRRFVTVLRSNFP
ncbi:MAG: hypothetical protein ACRECH_10735 [Nitrososphaerales archaeon]